MSFSSLESRRRSKAGCRVLVCEHLEGSLTVYYGPHRVGLFPHQALRLGIPPKTPDSH